MIFLHFTIYDSRQVKLLEIIVSTNTIKFKHAQALSFVQCKCWAIIANEVIHIICNLWFVNMVPIYLLNHSYCAIYNSNLCFLITLRVRLQSPKLALLQNTSVWPKFFCRTFRRPPTQFGWKCFLAEISFSAKTLHWKMYIISVVHYKIRTFMNAILWFFCYFLHDGFHTFINIKLEIKPVFGFSSPLYLVFDYWALFSRTLHFVFFL